MNISNQKLADRYMETKAEIEFQQKTLKELREEILATGKEEIEGNFCTVTVGLSERNSLDSKLVKEILTEAQIEACTKTSVVETLRVKAKIPA